MQQTLEPTGRPQTAVTNYPSTLRNAPEDRKFLIFIAAEA